LAIEGSAGTGVGGETDVDPDPSAALEEAFATEWGAVVATLIRLTGDWALAEDSAAEAFATAARRWPVEGVPRRPGAWLSTTARNAAVDRLRRRAAEQRALHRVAGDPTIGAWADADAEPGAPGWDGWDGWGGWARAAGTGGGTDGGTDDRLRLVFTCCHPALPLEGRVALTLRTLGGLEVAEVAAAFGVSDAAMAKRLVRARQKIAHARIPYRVPAPDELPERLQAVLAVLYLVFTEGYAPTTGAPVRTDLAAEAIRLAGQVAVLLPDEAEVHALLALMLLHDSRRTARVSPDGRLVPLEEQDRALWDRAQIERGLYELEASHRVADGAAGPYLLQASIAACHATARTPEETPWPMVAGLYEELAAIAPSPHVLLARAVAVGMAEGLDAGLAALAELGDSEPYGLRLAAEADLLRRYGHRAEAAEAYRAAAEHSEGAQREFLQGRHAELESE
jgi:RNA polymerase sigma-70 factor, ECF subfamily